MAKMIIIKCLRIWENIKRRMQNEHANNLKFMMQGFIEQMLPIVDNFERSLAIENPSEEWQTS